MEKTRGNGYMLHCERFHPNIKKKEITVRTIIPWNKFPRDVVESPSLEVFEMQLDKMIDSLI